MYVSNIFVISIILLSNVLMISQWILLGACLSTPNSQKKGYGRPKSAEPGSPLLRRALSPDRLHPRSAETKTSISPLANTVVKVTPRVTIAQPSHNSNDTCSDESNDSFKEANESAKGEKKVPSEQKADYSKLTHGISINLGNVGMSNSCGSTQLPRIAEEKDSPTGTKSDDYSSSKEIGTDKNEKQQPTCNNNQSGDAEKDQSDEHQATSGSKVSQCNKKEDTAVPQASAQQTVTSIRKNLDHRHHQISERPIAASMSLHKALVAEQRNTSKGNVEAHQEIKKTSRKCKSDSGDGAHSGTHENNAGLGRDKKN